MVARDLIFDTWTPLSFKRGMGVRPTGGRTWMQPTWVGTQHQRRLNAYILLQAYLDNAAREFLSENTEEEVRDNHREYGDANLLRAQILSALLGDTQAIVTDGADQFDAGADEAETEKKVENSPEAVAAHNFQLWARAWAEKERIQTKMIETERNAVGLGDGVYSLGWNVEKRRPRVRVWDPGFYFPVLETLDEDDFPRRIHIAWEEELDRNDAPLAMPVTSHQARTDGRVKVRRITWELRRLPDGQTQELPWNDERTPWTCYMSDGTWFVSPDQLRSPDDFTLKDVKWTEYEDPQTGEFLPWQDIDLGIDFIPVIHEPNSVAEQEHFGRSSLSWVLQILDDIANADTDLAAASGTAGAPVVALIGGTIKTEPRYRPGDVFSLGEKGDMKYLDTSKALDALIKYVQMLLERLQINSRVPSAVVGRLKPSEVPSGIALALSFGPLRSMIDEMRLVRKQKNPMIFKFAWRLAKINGMKDLPETFINTTIVHGSFLPNDVAAAVDAIEKLARSRALSFETAVAMLVAAGLPIPDAEAEVRRIESRDFTSAKDFNAASGRDHGAVMDYLGRKSVNPPPAPETAAGSELDGDQDGIINEPGFE